MKLTLFLIASIWAILPLNAQKFPVFTYESYTDKLNNLQVEGRFIGGLSGITYDKESDRYLAITDNSNTKNNNSKTATIYSFSITHPNAGQVSVSDVKILPLKDQLATINPESLRAINGNFIISDEGTYHTVIMKISAEGNYVQEIHKSTEMKYNSGFEGICLSENEKNLYFSMERPLDNSTVRGGEEENMGVISVYQYDLKSNEITGQYLYPLHVPPAESNLTEKQKESFRKDNGVTEILAFNNKTLIFLERAFLGGTTKKLHVRLYMVSLTEETNILTGNFDLLKPKKVFDFYTTDIPFEVDNIEGMTFNADKSKLYLISDDNFDHYGEQVTQIITLKIN